MNTLQAQHKFVHDTFTALDRDATASGLWIHRVKWHAEAEKRWQLASILCADAVFPITTAAEVLRAQLDLFASLPELARAQFLLGIGIAGAGA